MIYSYNISTLTTARRFGRVTVLLRRNFKGQVVFVVVCNIPSTCEPNTHTLYPIQRVLAVVYYIGLLDCDTLTIV